MKPLPPIPRPVARALYRLGASMFLILGFIGMVVPVMPTTVFFLLTVWCLVKLGDRRANRLLDHPRFGPPLRLFIEQGAMTRRGKMAALSGLALGGAMLLPVAGIYPWAAAAGITGMALVGLWLATRPEPPSDLCCGNP